MKGGLYSDQIEKILERYHDFAGVYASNELNEIPTNKKRFAFIMNLDPNTKEGSHWVGIYIDANKDKSIEYYDSFAREPSKEFMKKIKILVDKISPDTYLKFKVNKIKRQSEKSNNCGLMAARFVMDRLEGYDFPFCTGYNDVKESEEDAKKMREEFGYI